MVALKPIKKGEEIFNDYGSLPRSDLLRRYGYITDQYKEWDVVEIDIGKIREISMRSAQLTTEEVNERVSVFGQLSSCVCNLIADEIDQALGCIGTEL